MAREYVVTQGDDLIGIAGRFGFADTKKIEAANADLMKQRAAGILQPGDRVQIPDRSVKPLDGSEKKTNVYRLKSPARKLTIPLRDGKGQALADAKYTLTFDDERHVQRKGTTDAGGSIDVQVTWKEKAIVVALEQSVFRLELGHLDPLKGTDDGGLSGVAHRLTLLGYHPGPLDGSDEALMEGAILAFQRDQKLEETGEADPATRKKLDEVATAAAEKDKAEDPS